MEPLTLLQIVQRAPPSSDQEDLHLVQAYKGQLQLDVYFNAGLLTVHVIRGKELVAKTTTDTYTYAKVALIPQSKSWRRQPMRTQPRDGGAPCWDDKFTFELSAEEKKKRLLVSVWDKTGDDSTLIGCMSFGLRWEGANRTVAQGWYFLLSDPLGRRKHMEVTEDSLVRTAATQPLELSDIWRHPEWDTLHTVCVRRSDHGYGFTLARSCPTVISKVKPDSPAERAGVAVGDRVESVNGHQVACSTAERVARLVRHESRVVLGLRRGSFVVRLERSPWRPSMHCGRTRTYIDHQGACSSGGSGYGSGEDSIRDSVDDCASQRPLVATPPCHVTDCDMEQLDVRATFWDFY